MTLLNSLSAKTLQRLAASSANSGAKLTRKLLRAEEKALLQTVQIVPGQHEKQKHRQQNKNKQTKKPVRANGSNQRESHRLPSL